MKNCINIQNKFISKSRMAQYNCIDEYIENLQLSNQFYVPLSIVEISLRNSLNNFFNDKVRENWLFDKVFIKPQLKIKIDSAIKILKHQNKDITQDNIIAELSFGFRILKYFDENLYNYVKDKSYVKSSFYKKSK